MFLEDFPISVIVVLDLSVGPLVGAVVQVKRKSVMSDKTKREVIRDNGRMESPPGTVSFYLTSSPPPPAPLPLSLPRRGEEGLALSEAEGPGSWSEVYAC